MTDSLRPVAIVTGASSGIGREFAYRYAREGFDLVLVARSSDVLHELSGELFARFGVEAVVHVADLSTAVDVDALAESISRMPRVDQLVYSAGLAPEGDLAGSDSRELRRMIDINVTSLTLLNRAAVRRMRAQGSGTIVNIASGAGYQPTPYLAAYGASKSYVRMFSEAIYEENRSYGVRVLAVSPGDTETPMNPGATKGKRQPSQVVDTAWKAMTGRAPSVVDGRKNRLIAGLSRLLPTRTGLRIAERMFRDRA